MGDLINQAKDGQYVKDILSDFVQGAIILAKHCGYIKIWEGQLFQLPFIKGMKVRANQPHCGHPFNGPDGRPMMHEGRLLRGFDGSDTDAPSSWDFDTLSSSIELKDWRDQILYANQGEAGTKYERVSNRNSLKECDNWVNAQKYTPSQNSIPQAPGAQIYPIPEGDESDGVASLKRKPSKSSKGRGEQSNRLKKLKRGFEWRADRQSESESEGSDKPSLNSTHGESRSNSIEKSQYIGIPPPILPPKRQQSTSIATSDALQSNRDLLPDQTSSALIPKGGSIEIESSLQCVKERVDIWWDNPPSLCGTDVIRFLMDCESESSSIKLDGHVEESKIDATSSLMSAGQALDKASETQRSMPLLTIPSIAIAPPSDEGVMDSNNPSTTIPLSDSNNSNADTPPSDSNNLGTSDRSNSPNNLNNKDELGAPISLEEKKHSDDQAVSEKMNELRGSPRIPKSMSANELKVLPSLNGNCPTDLNLDEVREELLLLHESDLASDRVSSPEGCLESAKPGTELDIDSATSINFHIRGGSDIPIPDSQESNLNSHSNKEGDLSISRKKSNRRGKALLRKKMKSSRAPHILSQKDKRFCRIGKRAIAMKGDEEAKSQIERGVGDWKRALRVRKI